MVVRRATVGRRYLLDLQSADLVQWRTHWRHLTEDHQRLSEHVKKEVEHLIGGEPDTAVRRRLLDLRRALHNGRVAKATTAAGKLVKAGVEVPGLQSWLAASSVLDSQAVQGEELLSGYWTATESRILHEVNRSGIGATISTSSEAMGQALQRYSSLKGKQKADALRSAGEYVLRAATRTTPYGGFTEVSVVAPEQSDVPRGSQPQRHPRINIEVLATVRKMILDDPVLNRHLTVRLTDGIAFEEGRIRYVRRKSGGNRPGGRVTQRSEDIFFLSNDLLLDVVFTMFESQESWVLEDLVQAVSGSLTEVATSEECRDYVVELLRQSFLVSTPLEFSIFEVEPLARLQRGLADLPGPEAERMIAALNRVHGQLEALADPEAGLGESARRTRAIKEEFLELGLSPGSLPSPLVYLDTVAVDGRAPRPSTIQASMGQHLRQLTRILPLFDILQPDKALMHGYFRARFGDSVPAGHFLEFIQEFNEDLYDVFREHSHAQGRVNHRGEPLPYLNWLDVPELNQLNAARSSLVTEFGRRFDAWRQSASGTLELDDAFFSDLADQLSAKPGTLYSVTGQPIDQDGVDQEFMVNGFYAGHGLMMSRFLHTEEPDSATVLSIRRYLEGRQSPELIFAEISGGHDSTNLNLHRQTIRHQIICPGEGLRGDPAYAIDLDDLEIRSDHGTPILWSGRLQARIVPVYQGFLVPYALPDLQRVLLLFSPMTVPVMDLWSGVDPPLEDREISDHPRVTYGPLVLVRHVWKMQPSHVPRRDGQDEPKWFATMDRWRQDNGLPARVFVTIDTEPRIPDGEPGRSKPQFVDFDNPWTLAQLDRLAGKAHSRVVMVEALPDPITPSRTGERDRTAVELVMEVAP